MVGVSKNTPAETCRPKHNEPRKRINKISKALAKERSSVHSLATKGNTPNKIHAANAKRCVFFAPLIDHHGGECRQHAKPQQKDARTVNNIRPPKNVKTITFKDELPEFDAIFLFPIARFAPSPGWK